jgi:thymidine phosphorylase
VKLPSARVMLDVPAPRAGVLSAMDTRAIGLTVVDLGGGRRMASDAIDPAVGLSHIEPFGTRVSVGQPLMRVHARSRAQAQAAIAQVQRALTFADAAPTPRPVVIARVARAGKPRRTRVERAS